MNQGESGVSGKIPTPNNLSSVLNVGKPEAAGSTEMQENVDRIVKAARVSMNNGSARIQIRLEPPELGYLRVEIKQSGNGWHLQMQATNVKRNNYCNRTVRSCRRPWRVMGYKRDR